MLGNLSCFWGRIKVLFSGDSINIVGAILGQSSSINCWDKIKSRKSFDKQIKREPIKLCGGHVTWKSNNYAQSAIKFNYV